MNTLTQVAVATKTISQTNSKAFAKNSLSSQNTQVIDAVSLATGKKLSVSHSVKTRPLSKTRQQANVVVSSETRFDKKHCHPPTSATNHESANRVPRILFVDDDTDIQATLEIRMRPFAVEVEQAYFGMQGISEAIKHQPDLILMDIAMPNGNGEYLLETIKRNGATADIPVIVFTGMRDATLRNKMMQLGAASFVQKPASFDDLLVEMKQFVDIQKK